jgi:hypothetical protein
VFFVCFHFDVWDLPPLSKSRSWSKQTSSGAFSSTGAQRKLQSCTGSSLIGCHKVGMISDC